MKLAKLTKLSIVVHSLISPYFVGLYNKVVIRLLLLEGY